MVSADPFLSLRSCPLLIACVPPNVYWSVDSWSRHRLHRTDHDWKHKQLFVDSQLEVFVSLVWIFQGHPTTVTSLKDWNVFLGYTEYSWISRNAFISRAIKLYLFDYTRGTWGFSKLQGLHCYFPDKFRCNWTFHESENFFLILSTSKFWIRKF